MLLYTNPLFKCKLNSFQVFILYHLLNYSKWDKVFSFFVCFFCCCFLGLCLLVNKEMWIYVLGHGDKLLIIPCALNISPELTVLLKVCHHPLSYLKSWKPCPFALNHSTSISLTHLLLLPLSCAIIKSVFPHFYRELDNF